MYYVSVFSIWYLPISNLLNVLLVQLNALYDESEPFTYDSGSIASTHILSITSLRRSPMKVHLCLFQ